MTDRLERLRRSMAEEGVDAVVLGPGPHLHWALNVRPHADETNARCWPSSPPLTRPS